MGFVQVLDQRFALVILVSKDYQVDYDLYNEPFAVSPYKGLYLDMHGLIFETSV